MIRFVREDGDMGLVAAEVVVEKKDKRSSL